MSGKLNITLAFSLSFPVSGVQNPHPSLMLHQKYVYEDKKALFQNPFLHTLVTWKVTHHVNVNLFLLVVIFPSSLSGSYAIVLKSKALQ